MTIHDLAKLVVEFFEPAPLSRDFVVVREAAANRLVTLRSDERSLAKSRLAAISIAIMIAIVIVAVVIMIRVVVVGMVVTIASRTIAVVVPSAVAATIVVLAPF